MQLQIAAAIWRLQTMSCMDSFRPGRCHEIPEILKFVLKLELGPVICTYILKFSRVFTIFLKTSFYLSVSNTGHKESSVVPDFSIKMACRGHSRSIILRSLESR